MAHNEVEYGTLLAAFGRLIVKQFDRSLDQVQSGLEHRSLARDIAFQKHLDTLSESERQLKIAQDALEVFIHDLMAALNESEEYRIDAIFRGMLIDLKTLPDESLHWSAMDWIDDYSKRKSVSSIINEIEDKSAE